MHKTVAQTCSRNDQRQSVENMDWGLEIKKGDAEEGIGYTGHGITLLYEVF